MDTERLSKYLARAGVGSRRRTDEMIRNGHVIINGIRVLEPWYNVNTAIDIITIDNKIISIAKKDFYIALYKPTGYLSDLKGQAGRKIARDLIPLEGRLFPVGRLDLNSEGLLIFTNDGEFAHRIMHPRFGSTKEYLVKFQGTIVNGSLERIRNGVRDSGQVLSVIEIERLRDTASNTWCRVVLGEGRYREIRRIGAAVGHGVLKLRRTRIGHIALGNMRPGEFRNLEDWEIHTVVGKGSKCETGGGTS